MRLPGLEAALVGQPIAAACAVPADEHLAALAPIDDVRATAAYRRHAALVLLRRALTPPAEALRGMTDQGDPADGERHRPGRHGTRPQLG